MQDIAMQLFGQLLSGFAYVLVIALVSYVGVLFRKLQPKINIWLDANTSAAQQKLIKELGHQAFVYAETVFRDKNGSDKLHEALSFFNKNMDKYGLPNLSYEVIRNTIERAWLQDKSMRSFDVQVDASSLEPEEVAPVVEAESQTS